jgi:predicted outer membrane repeat protein
VVVDITDSLVMRPGPAPMVTISRSNQGGMLRILENGTSVTIEDLTFSNPNGSAIAIGMGPQVILRRCLFDGNINSSGSASGGAISVGGETTVDTCTFRNNSSAITSGGAIFLGTNALLTIQNSTIEDNLAGNGGGIAVGNGTERLVLLNTVIQRNQATGDGGGIYSQSRIEAEGVSIYDNIAGDDGGGVWAQNQTGGNSIQAVNFVGADIRGNTAAGDGGGVFFDTGVGLHEFLLSRSAVWENEATRGGGVYIFGSTDTLYQIANSTIGLNTADMGGGIYHAIGDLEVLHTTIWDNQSEQLRNPGPSFFGKVGNSIIGFEFGGASGCLNAPTQLGPNLASDASCGASLVGDPEFGPFANTGGYAPTLPFADTSPALDTADLMICGDPPIEFYDSDGPNRPNGTACDLGSWESGTSLFSNGFESGNTAGWSAAVQ